MKSAEVVDKEQLAKRREHSLPGQLARLARRVEELEGEKGKGAGGDSVAGSLRALGERCAALETQLGIAAQANAKIEALEKRVKSLEGLLDDDDKGKGKK